MDVKKWGVGVLAAGALFAAGFIGMLAFTGDAQAEGGPSEMAGKVRSFLSGDKLDEKLAQKLGVTVERLRTAREEARKELLQEAVAAGALTQEQADRILSGEWRGFPRGEMGALRGAKGVPGIHVDIHAVAAGVLNLTPEALRAELSQGKSLAQVATERGVSVAALKAAILDAQKARISQLVADGRLTQDQADRILQGLESRIDTILNAIHTGGGMRHRMGRDN
jgi:polyhydroxyalkanoate synthesis regulator phasin